MIDFEKLSKMCNEEEFLTYVVETTGFDLQKINEGMEYEIKFATKNEELKLQEINKDISNILERSGYFVNRIERETDYYVDFFCSLKDGFEYSVFIYESKVMMKIKKHNKIQHDNFTLCESQEIFEYDYTKILNTICREDLIYMGTMRKHRVKDFILDKSNGFIYASAVSKCIVLDKLQTQYELEYYGHYSGMSTNANKDVVINELISLAEIIVADSNGLYYPDNQTKLEFVQSNLLEIDQTSKQTVISNIKEKMFLEKEILD